MDAPAPHCTVHLFDCCAAEITCDGSETDQKLDDDALDDIWREFTAELLKRYPGARGQFRNGDIIELTKASGYRAEGVYMVRAAAAGEILVVPLCYDYDMYGTINPAFVTLRDFPPGYWEEPQAASGRRWRTTTTRVNNTFAPGRESAFSWHSPMCRSFYDINALRAAVVDETGALTLCFGGKKYVIAGFEFEDDDQPGAWECLLARGENVIGRLEHPDDDGAPCKHLIFVAY